MAWMVSVKALLISMGVLLMGLAMKVSVPLATEFLRSHLPVMWSSFLTWLRPPYLYVIINGIIFIIAASSRFHHHDDPVEDRLTNPKIVSDPGMGRYEEEKEVSREFEGLDQVRSVVVYEQREEEEEEEVAHEAEAEPVDKYENDHYEGDDDDEEVLVSRSPPRVKTPPRRIDSPELFFSPAEKPLVSARFGSRKPVKPVPEGGKSSSLKVSKPKRHETMENTWKMITEGRSMPLSRHMKKCDTWENQGRHINVRELDQPSPLVMMKKSETFKDRTNEPMPRHDHGTYTPPASTGNYKLRKEPSLSQDELNKRVEAFIQKFNEEMRLQRQESLNQYMEMINRGSQ